MSHRAYVVSAAELGALMVTALEPESPQGRSLRPSGSFLIDVASDILEDFLGKMPARRLAQSFEARFLGVFLGKRVHAETIRGSQIVAFLAAERERPAECA